MKPQILLFDINETVLDLSALAPAFENQFSSVQALPLWFSKLLHSSVVCISSATKSNFAELASNMLDEVASNFDIPLSSQDKQQLLAGFATLPAHQDIVPAFKALKQAGFTLVALSNSSLALIDKQIEHAQLNEYFDQVISVESTGSFKPDPQVYHFAAKTLGQPTDSLCLIATHDWDTHGALSAGLNAAYIKRKNQPYNPAYLSPAIHANSMTEMADKLIKSFILPI